MPRPQGHGPMSHADMKFLTKAVWAFVALIWFFMWLLPSPASSRPALLCTPDKTRCFKITLPKPGKCKWISGYKVCR